MLRLKDLSWAVTALVLLLLGTLYIYGINVFGDRGFAQGLTGVGSAQSSAPATASATTPATRASTAKTITTPSHAAATAREQSDLRQLRELMATSPKVSATLLTSVDTRIDATGRQFDSNAARLGDSRVAEMLAQRFRVSATSLTQEHKKLHTPWGQLMIARSLAARCGKWWITPEMLLQLKSHGMGWGQIASGLGLSVGSAVTSVRGDARVSNGLTRSLSSSSRMQLGGAGSGMSHTMGLNTGMRGGLGHFNHGLGLGRVKLK